MNKRFHLQMVLLTFLTFPTSPPLLAAATLIPQLKIENPDIGHLTAKFGWSTAIDGDTMVIGSLPEFNTRGSARVYERNAAGDWILQAELRSYYAQTPAGFSLDGFGHSVAISGDTVVVGAPYETHGAAYVFKRDASGWTQQAKLTQDTFSTQQFGYSVSISGDNVVVGTNNALAYLFTYNGTTWERKTQLSSGNSVSISGDTIVVGNHQWNSNSGYIIVHEYNGTYWQQLPAIFPSDGATGDKFGFSVSVSEDEIIVGAPLDDDYGSASGSAYLFSKTGTEWNQTNKLVAPDARMNFEFGTCVSISGNSLAVAGDTDDTVNVYVRSGSDWVIQTSLPSPDNTDWDGFGKSVSISGDTLAIGAYQDTFGQYRGSAYVYTRSNSEWTQQSKIYEDIIAQGDFFGSSVSVSGDTLIIGAHADDGKGGPINSGAAYVYTNNGTNWILETKLAANDPAASDIFGSAVSISGDTVAVGAPYANGRTGAVYVFTRNGTVWEQHERLISNAPVLYSNFGVSVAIEEDIIVVGSREDGSDHCGYAYVFRRTGDTWLQQARLSASDSAPNSRFGASVSISGDTIVVGAIDDDEGSVNSGAAYVFVPIDGVWTQQAKLKPSDVKTEDSFGIAVSIDGDTVLIGALGAFSSDSGYKSFGSAYVFVRNGASWKEQVKFDAFDAESSQFFGCSVSMCGDTAVVGAGNVWDSGSFMWNGRYGSAVVYSRSGSVWTKQAKVVTAKGGYGFGYPVVTDGELVFIGDAFDGPEPNAGTVHVLDMSTESGIGKTWVRYP